MGPDFILDAGRLKIMLHPSYLNNDRKALNIPLLVGRVGGWDGDCKPWRPARAFGPRPKFLMPGAMRGCPKPLLDLDIRGRTPLEGVELDDSLRLVFIDFV